jgi:hypothetical protein
VTLVHNVLCSSMGETTSLKNLVATFAAHIASEAARG